MAISNKDFFIGHVIWTALAAIAKRFPGALIRMKQASSKSIHEMEVLSKNGTKICKLCFIAKYADTEDRRWSFFLSAKENGQIEDAERRGFEPFLLLAASRTGVVCANRLLYHTARNQRKNFSFSIRKRRGDHSYRVGLPDNKTKKVSQKSFPGKIIDHIEEKLG